MRPWHVERLDASGKVKVLTLVLIAAVVGGGYMGFVYHQPFLDHLDVRQACEEALNATYEHRDPQRTERSFVRRARRIRYRWEDVGGIEERVSVIDPEPKNLLVGIDHLENPPALFIELSYEREERLPLLDRSMTFRFSTSCRREL